METHELVKALKGMSDRAHKRYNRSLGKRGGRCSTSDFYMGAYASIDSILHAVENDDMKTLEQWAKP